ncbi:hypothetical protein [Rubrivirga sp. IMCC45206]|uniref:hypothetical protein n=1 Tax=Rubrivirga sp. IMCC45206 TaxID=3391614 RepID=UPI00399035E7
MRLSPLLLLALLAAPLAAQPAAPCIAPEADGLDFWVGTWDLEWDTPTGTASGTNVITREHSGCVVRERFTGAGGYAGESVSVRTPAGWRQTWVDNRAGYLTFEGETNHSGRVTAMRQPPFENVQGQTQHNRMVWQDVTADALVWRWQASTDGGETWTDNWVIRYTRADDGP